MTNKIENWLRVDVVLHQKLEELQVLDKEREMLIKKAEKEGITSELERELNNSLARYTKLANEVSELKKKSKQIK